jgi:16S rRNA (guanine527-N7)-methyltransferase
VVELSSELAARWPDVSAVLNRQPWNGLTSHLLKAGVDPDASIARLRRYCELALQWNRKVSNLISRNDEDRIVQRHIAESLEPAHWLKESGAKRWLDFGSGAGLPAIPLVIGGVGDEWTLVESRRTKTLFLRRALDELVIGNVTVINARLEDLLGSSELLASYDGFTSRATQTLVPTLAIAANFVRPGGTAFLWKGSRREEEMSVDESWRQNWDFDGLLAIGDGTPAVARFRRK